MKVIIEKTAKVVIEIPDDYVNEYFGENISESAFVAWADRDVNVDHIHEMKEVDNKLNAWINCETTSNIEVEGGPKSLKSSYNQEEIDEIITERENAEHCYECTGYGDDYYTDPETGELISSCDTCPFNPKNN